ncbi:hypothetical protein ACFL43_07345 [Thermodesulfobacteriota bacterium]
MKKICLILLVGCLMLLPGFAGAETADSKDIVTKIVRIRGYEGVAPLNIFIAPGTVVVWLNQYHGEVKITFPQKKVTLACKSPVNFVVNDKGFFESRAVTFGAVASLCFVEQGTFEYFIERNPASLRAKSEGFRFEGKIVVK